MTVKYPIWINKIEGAAQTPEEMNGLVEVLQNHADNLSLQQKQILTSSGGIYPEKVIPTSPFPEGISQAVFLVGPGTYPNYGNKTIPANNLGLIFFYNSTFDLVTIEIPVYDDTSIQNKVTNIENRTTALENKNGGEVKLGDSKNVIGGKVFDYVNNKSITKFNPTAYEGGYPKDALVFYNDNVWMSMVNLNTETPQKGTSKWKEVKMSADVDQEFDENSENSIANKEVSKLAKSLEGFKIFDSELIKVIDFNDITNQGYFINKNNQLEKSSISDTFVIHNYDVSVFNELSYSIKGRVDKAFILLGIKSDGNIVNIIPNVIKNTIYSNTIDISIYDKISISSTLSDNSFDFKLKKTPKKYVDLYDFFDPSKDIFLNKNESSGRGNLIYNNTILIGGYILSKDNTVVGQSGYAAGLNINANEISGKKIVWRGKRRTSDVPSGLRTPFLVVLNDNSIVSLVDYLQGDVNLVEEVVIEIPANAKTFSTSTVSNVTGGFGIFEYMEQEAEGTYYRSWTDFIKSNSGNGNEVITDETYIAVNVPSNSLPRLDLIGTLPTDATSRRTPTDMIISLSVNNQVRFKAKSSTKFQGNSTATLPKKGYALSFTNSNDEELELRINNWVKSSEYHLKAYHTDDLLNRDITCGKLWNKIINSRESSNIYVSPHNLLSSGASNKDLFTTEALFYTDGFPVDVYLNNQFYGVYIFRQKKEIDNYRLEKSIKSNIQLEALGYSSFTGFTPSHWELRNPKISGYEEGKVINDAEVSAYVDRFFNWTKGILNSSIDFKSTYANYIDKESWIQFLIFNEFVYGLDSMRKNFHLMTWDGDIWVINPYDMDGTLGYHFTTAPKFQENLVLNNNYGQPQPLFVKFYNEFLPEIKLEYARLRKNILTVSYLYELYKEIPTTIGYSKLKDNYSKWGSYQEDTFGVAPHNMRINLYWIDNRLKYLDSIWLNS